MSDPVFVGSATASCDSLATYPAFGGPVRPIIGLFTVPTGLTNGCVVVAVHNSSTLGDFVVWDGSGTQYPLTLVDRIGGSYGAELWYALGVPAGTYQTYRNGGSADGGAVISWWRNVDQADPVPVAYVQKVQTFGAAPVSVTLPSVPAGYACVDAFGTQFSSGAAPVEGDKVVLGANVTDTTGAGIYISSSARFASGNVAMSWSLADGAIIAAALKGASGGGGGGGSTQRRTLGRALGRALNRGLRGD